MILFKSGIKDFREGEAFINNIVFLSSTLRFRAFSFFLFPFFIFPGKFELMPDSLFCTRERGFSF